MDYTKSLNVVYFPQLGGAPSNLFVMHIQVYPCPGFLICVPMQEGWTSEEGIQVLDGWSFQVIVRYCS